MRPHNAGSFLLLLGVVATVAFAQDVRIERSHGFAEIETAQQWLQAIAGRPVPEGARIATWFGARVTIAFGDVAVGDTRADLDQLGLITIDRDGDAYRIIHRSGVLRVVANGTPLIVDVAGAVIHVERAILEYDGGRLRLLDGRIDVDYGSFVRSYSRPVDVLVRGRPKSSVLYGLPAIAPNLD
ncbi:MAG: hypothetical protein EA382_04925 [Spirochaetaceae bacterium]|nr:MAG: hypothetical protein EA382_04925 [Spirochaetaceae bacterium]